MNAPLVCTGCGGALPGGGLCFNCAAVSDLRVAVSCATSSTLALNRLTWLGLKLGEAIAASTDNPVVLDRGLAFVMHGHLTDANFEADAAVEAECDRALSARAQL